MPWAGKDYAHPPRSDFLTSDVLSQIIGGKDTRVQEFVAGGENFAQYALECLWATAEGQLEPDQFPTAIAAAGLTKPCSAELCHVFWLVWADVEGPNLDAFCEEFASEACDATLNTDQARSIVAALKECRKSKLIEDRDLLEVLDVRLLVQCGATSSHKDPQSFSRKIISSRNSKGLKVKIFTAFREELEGFSKLVTLLNNPAITAETQTEKLKVEIDQLAGYYLLSPGKVASCIMVAMERDPTLTQVMISLPYLLPRWCLEYISSTMKGATLAGARSLAPSFFRVVALLLRCKKLNLQEVLSEMSSHFDELSKPEMAKSAAEQMNSAVPSSSHVSSSASWNVDISLRDCALTSAIGNPVPVQLVIALVQHGSWSDARIVLQNSKFLMPVHRAICFTLLDRLDACLQHHFQALFPSGPFGVCIVPVHTENVDRSSVPVASPLPVEALQVLQEIGPLAFRRPDLLVHLWRLLTHLLLTHAPSSSPFADALFAVRHCALPASCFLPAHTQVWALAQGCLFLLPQMQRCQLYHDTAALLRMTPCGKNDEASGIRPDLVFKLLDSHAKEVAALLGQLCKKCKVPKSREDLDREVRHNSKLVNKAITCHPIAAAARVAELCRMYDTNMEVFVAYTGTLLPLVRELFVYEAIRQLLTETRGRANQHEASPDVWLNNLSLFLGKFIAKYEDLDLYVVFAHVAQNSRDIATGNGLRHPLEVIIAGSIFDHTIGRLPEQLNTEQRLALFLGPIFRAYKLKNAFISQHTLELRCQRILRSLHGADARAVSLVIPLYIILCQQRSNVCTSREAQHVRAAFEVTQRTHHVLLGYLQLIKALPVAELACLLPKLPVLLHDYQIGPECAMSLYRPLLRVLCHLDQKTAEGPLETMDTKVPGKILCLPRGNRRVLEPLQYSSDSCGSGVVLCDDASEPATKSLSSQPPGVGLSSSFFFKDLCACIPMLSEKTGRAHFDPSFYVIFWALELPDLAENVQELYSKCAAALTTDIDLLQKNAQQLESQQEQYRRRQPRQATDDNTPIVTMAQVEQAHADLQVMQGNLEKLPEESKLMERRTNDADAVLARYAPTFIPNSSGQKHQCHVFMQECIVPRCILSVEDALFCAQFLYKLASIEATNFQISFAATAVFGQVSLLLRSCTQHETTNLAFFFKQMHRLTDRLIQEDKFKIATKSESEPDDMKDKVHSLHKKFQKQMCTALTTVLNAPDSGDVIVKNALNMITELMPEFPTAQEEQQSLLRALETLKGTKPSDSIAMLLDAVVRSVSTLHKKEGEGDAAEDGEVTNDGDTGVGGFVSKRPRDHHVEDSRSTRHRATYDHGRQGRQFGGERGAGHR